MSPATIRSWISNGTLQATRAGRRKWLVRRSELDRMLGGQDLLGPEDQPGGPGWRLPDTIAPPHRSPHWSEEAREHVGRGELARRRRDRVARGASRERDGPPDPGFVVRLKDIADAAARKAAALDNLDDDRTGRVVAAAVGAARRLSVLRAAFRREQAGAGGAVGEIRSGGRRARSRDGGALGAGGAIRAGRRLARPPRDRRCAPRPGGSPVAAAGRGAGKRRR